MIMAIQKNERFIPLKNYVIAIFIVLLAIGATWYAFAWHNAIRDNKVSTSYLVKEKILQEINDISEASSVFSEAPSSYFVLVSYTGDEKVYNMEKELKDIIKDNDLSDKMYYLNVTSIKDEENYIDRINEELNLTDRKISQVPSVVYVKDGKAVDIVSRSDNNMMSSGDFQKMLDINGITK